MKTRVVHSQKVAYDVYIGRPSIWGNPFQIGRDGTRKEVIAKYRAWLLKNPRLLGRLSEIRGKTLGCWCSPLACHGDVLAELAETHLRTIIAGPRAFKNYSVISRVMEKCPWTVSEVVSGKARGVDTLGEQWAKEKGLPIKPFPADWDRLGDAAGTARNVEMAKYADALVAINTGTIGTGHMIKEARKRGLQVLVATIKPKVRE